MTESICGLDCGHCELNSTCGGCAATKGRPFGGSCIMAACCQSRGQESCRTCDDGSCRLKTTLIREFNALGIADMEEVTGLNALKGSYINLESFFSKRTIHPFMGRRSDLFGKSDLQKEQSPMLWSHCGRELFIGLRIRRRWLRRGDCGVQKTKHITTVTKTGVHGSQGDLSSKSRVAIRQCGSFCLFTGATSPSVFDDMHKI